jgi:hypothetical protein
MTRPSYFSSPVPAALITPFLVAPMPMAKRELMDAGRLLQSRKSTRLVSPVKLTVELSPLKQEVVGSSGNGGRAMTKKLLALIEKTRHIQLTPEQEREQEIDFAYGNVHFENPRVTRELVERSLPACEDGAESNR